MKRSQRISTIVLILGFAIVLGSASAASACPSCQTALATDGSQGDLARGIYYSVLFMMAMPFAIVGTFAGFAYRAVKREQRRLEALQKAEQAADE
jgi:cytochrome c biogenesis protein CcdA